LTLDRPGELSSTLDAPQLPGLLTAVADYDQLLQTALENSPELNSIKTQLATVDEERNAIRAERYPELFLQLEANAYRQEFGSRSPYRAIVGLDIPLYQGNRVDAELAAIEAKRQALRAEARQTEFRIRQAVLETLQQIETLRMQLKQAEIREDYRELYLDRSRAQYELEINTDLGDAMVEQSAARAFAAKTRFDLALARETLAILTGDPALSALSSPSSINSTGEATP
jgi:outer membrane protein TolC